MVCKMPGYKIRSKGLGRGLGRGKGKGPMGVPFKAKAWTAEIRKPKGW